MLGGGGTLFRSVLRVCAARGSLSSRLRRYLLGGGVAEGHHPESLDAWWVAVFGERSLGFGRETSRGREARQGHLDSPQRRLACRVPTLTEQLASAGNQLRHGLAVRTAGGKLSLA